MDPIAASVTALSSGVGVFANLMPSVSKVRRTDPNGDPADFNDVRSAELVAGGAMLLIGAGAAVVSHSAKPLVLSAVAVAGLVALYEWHLQAAPK